MTAMDTLNIDDDVPIPVARSSDEYITQRRRLEYAANTLDALPHYGTKKEKNIKYKENPHESTPHELLLAEAVGRELPVETVKDILSTPARVREAQRLIAEFDYKVVQSAVSLRNYVTNRLIIESNDASPKIRVQALTLLGKITDVGLFTDKTEISVINRTSEELEARLHEKLRRYMINPDVEDASICTVDLRAELEQLDNDDNGNGNQ